MASRSADVHEIRRRQRASVLAIGTANPANCVRQDEYADWYFRVTKSDHLPDLKAKMKRMCKTQFSLLICFFKTQEY